MVLWRLWSQRLSTRKLMIVKTEWTPVVTIIISVPSSMFDNLPPYL